MNKIIMLKGSQQSFPLILFIYITTAPYGPTIHLNNLY